MKTFDTYSELIDAIMADCKATVANQPIKWPTKAFKGTKKLPDGFYVLVAEKCYDVERGFVLDKYIVRYQYGTINGKWYYDSPTTEMEGIEDIDCPLSLLKKATEPVNEIAKEWRERVATDRRWHRGHISKELIEKLNIVPKPRVGEFWQVMNGHALKEVFIVSEPPNKHKSYTVRNARDMNSPDKKLDRMFLVKKVS